MQTQSVSIKELRDNLAQIIEEVAIAKKRVEITKFGKSKAVIIPMEQAGISKKKETKIDWTKLPAFGIWKDRKDMKDSAKCVRDLRHRESTRRISKLLHGKPIT